MIYPERSTVAPDALFERGIRVHYRSCLCVVRVYAFLQTRRGGIIFTFLFLPGARGSVSFHIYTLRRARRNAALFCFRYLCLLFLSLRRQ